MKNVNRAKPYISSLFFSCLVVAAPAFAGMKKWVDEEGNVHYGDRIPTQYLSKQHDTLNEQGLIVKTQKAMKTDAELSMEEETRKKKAEEDKLLLVEQRKQALRDRVLLDTFTTEKDIEIARDARLDALDSQLSLANTLIESDEKKLHKVQKRIKEIENTGRKVPDNLHKKVTAVSRQLENSYSFIEDKNIERQNILTNFDEDIKRFRELKSRKRNP